LEIFDSVWKAAVGYWRSTVETAAPVAKALAQAALSEEWFWTITLSGVVFLFMLITMVALRRV